MYLLSQILIILPTDVVVLTCDVFGKEVVEIAVGMQKGEYSPSEFANSLGNYHTVIAELEKRTEIAIGSDRGQFDKDLYCR